MYVKNQHQLLRTYVCKKTNINCQGHMYVKKQHQLLRTYVCKKNQHQLLRTYVCKKPTSTVKDICM